MGQVINPRPQIQQGQPVTKPEIPRSAEYPSWESNDDKKGILHVKQRAQSDVLKGPRAETSEGDVLVQSP